MQRKLIPFIYLKLFSGYFYIKEKNGNYLDRHFKDKVRYIRWPLKNSCRVSQPPLFSWNGEYLIFYGIDPWKEDSVRYRNSDALGLAGKYIDIIALKFVNITVMLAFDGCGYGFRHHNRGKQDIPGFGQIRGHIFANRTSDCTYHCIKEPDCCSFEWREAFQIEIRICLIFKRRCLLRSEMEIYTINNQKILKLHFVRTKGWKISEVYLRYVPDISLIYLKYITVYFRYISCISHYHMYISGIFWIISKKNHRFILDIP